MAHFNLSTSTAGYYMNVNNYVIPTRLKSSRVQVSQLLDGTTTVLSFGSPATDNDLTIRAELSESEKNKIVTMMENYNEFALGIEGNLYRGVIVSFNYTPRGRANIQFHPSEVIV